MKRDVNLKHPPSVIKPKSSSKPNDIESKIKVLAMLPAARIGGAEKNLMMIIEALKQEGIEVVLAIGSDEGGNDDIIRERRHILNNTRARGSIFSAIKIIAIEKPSIVFLNLGYVNLALFIRLIFPWIIIVVRMGNTVSSELPNSKLIKLIKIIILKCSYIACSKIIAQSNAMKKDLLSLISIKNEKIIVLQNTVENDYLYKTSEKNFYDIKLYMFCAATFKKQKRIDILIKSSLSLMMKNPDINLVIAGISKSEIHESGLLKNVEKNFLDRIHFLGFVSNIYPLIRDSLFCVSSSDYEGSSNFLIEAKEMNKFCLVTDCPGSNKEIFTSQDDVIFVSPGNDKLLTLGMEESLRKIYSSQKNKSNMLPENNKIIPEKRISWENQLIRIFRK